MMLNTIELKINQFNQLREIIYSHCGINITPQKKIMIEARLRKRLVKLNFQSTEEYFDYLNDDNHFETELVQLIDVVTTNKTDFFRENDHFNFLVNNILEEYRQNSSQYVKKHLTVWSSACSSGEEPYTIAMVLENYKEANNFLDYSIFASDISTIKLSECKKAVYSESQIEPVEESLRQKYLLKSKNPDSKLFRIVPEIREKVSLARLNLKTEVSQIQEQFDIIFCRNVIIYFDKITQKEIVGNLIRKLNPGGYLFMGHSESLINLDLNVQQVGSSVYRTI